MTMVMIASASQLKALKEQVESRIAAGADRMEAIQQFQMTLNQEYVKAGTSPLAILPASFVQVFLFGSFFFALNSMTLSAPFETMANGGRLL